MNLHHPHHPLTFTTPQQSSTLLNSEENAEGTDEASEVSILCKPSLTTLHWNAIPSYANNGSHISNRDQQNEKIKTEMKKEGAVRGIRGEGVNHGETGTMDNVPIQSNIISV